MLTANLNPKLTPSKYLETNLTAGRVFFFFFRSGDHVLLRIPSLVDAFESMRLLDFVVGWTSKQGVIERRSKPEMFCRWVCRWQDNQAGWNGLAGGRACRARAFGVLGSLEGFGGCIWALWPLGPSAEQAEIRASRVHSRGSQGAHRASHRRCRPLGR